MRKQKTIYRSAKSGKFVKKSYAQRNPKTTVKEKRPSASSPGPKKTVRRSSVSGKFVSKQRVNRHPKTTVTERRKTSRRRSR